MQILKRTIPYKVAREMIAKQISGKRKKFSSMDLHHETNLPYPIINRVLEEFEKEGKVKEHDETRI